MTSRGVRAVRAISRIDCWAKIGAKFDFRAAATWPGVARPRRSPNPNDFLRPRTVGVVSISAKFQRDAEVRQAVSYQFVAIVWEQNHLIMFLLGMKRGYDRRVGL